MPPTRAQKAVYFKSPAEFRAWLEQHHATTTEVVVGFHKKHTRMPSMTWPESVDEALCFGWIDGVRWSVDKSRYAQRFSPRKPTSNWSAINIKRVAELTKDGRMRPAGLRAFDKRRPIKAGAYSYEQRSPDLPPQYAKLMKKNKAAWAYFSARPPGYRKITMWWIVSAKREETRLKRLNELIKYSARKQPIPGLDRTKK